MTGETVTTTSAPTNTTSTTAATGKSGLTLSPALSTIQPGKSYALTLKNTSAETVTVKLNPALYSVDANTNKVIPAPQSAYKKEQPLNAYINITQANFTLAAGETKAIDIRYSKEYPDFFLGVEAAVGRFEAAPNVGAIAKLSSVIVSTEMSETDFNKLDTSLQVRPSLGLAGINLGSDVTLTSTFKNTTNKLLKPSGDISIHSGEKRIDNLVLTTAIPSSVYPTTGFEIQNNFKDDRPFWQRVGTTAYRQHISVNGKVITREVQQLSLPWEFLLVVLLITVAVFIIAYTASKRYLNTATKPAKASKQGKSESAISAKALNKKISKLRHSFGKK